MLDSQDQSKLQIMVPKIKTSTTQSFMLLKKQSSGSHCCRSFYLWNHNLYRFRYENRVPLVPVKYPSFVDEMTKVTNMPVISGMFNCAHTVLIVWKYVVVQIVSAEIT